MKPIRVLIVDDSSFIRRTLAAIIRTDPGMKVAGLASNGRQAVEMAEELKPDIITMDINMPGMDGLEALEKIMRASPTAVLMVSQLTEEGAQATMEALSKGAVDFVTKSEGDSAIGLIKLKSELLTKIRELTRRPPRPSRKKPSEKKKGPSKKNIHTAEMVAIGASTGGPKALMKVMSNLPGVFPASGAIVQHMPPTFIKTFTGRLDGISQVTVKLAENGELVSPATFLVAPGHVHMKFKAAANGTVRVRLDPKPANSMHRPSVDQTFLSLADAYPGRALGVVMTGMGQDGLIGAKAMREKGCAIIAQDEKSCVIYGMPRAVVISGVAAALPLSELPDYIVRSIRK